MRRILLALGLAGAVAVGAASCGGRDDPVRIAVQVDCQGAFSSYGDISLAGAFLPLLERGARLTGPSPANGVEHARVAGRPVEVKVACTETGEPTYAAPQLRQLLEEWDPDVVVGSGLADQDGIIVRDLAKRYTDTTFLVTVPSAQSITMFDPARNVFRLNLDNAQSVAGLASYAYHHLGWRRAAVVGGDFPDDWEEAAGFVSEFCALGGTATRDDGRAWTDAPGTARRYATTVDGVAVLASFLAPTAFLQAMAKRPERVASRMVIGGWAFGDPATLSPPGAHLDDVVIATPVPWDAGPPAWQKYLASFTKAYPGLPPGTAAGQLVVPYRNAVEGVASALEEVGGDPGADGRRLREALAVTPLHAVPAPMTLDRNRQAIAPVYLSRLGPKRGGAPTARTVGVVRAVDQAFGGIFGPPHGAPTAVSPACDRSVTPPAWAR